MICKWMMILLVPCALLAEGMGGTILLYNDSTFILTATIQSSDGIFLGQFSIQPGEQKNFTTHMSPTDYNTPGRPQVSITPYTVIWQCPSEGFYSMSTDVSPGQMITANSSPGYHFCSPKKDLQKDQPPASSLKKTK